MITRVAHRIPALNTAISAPTAARPALRLAADNPAAPPSIATIQDRVAAHYRIQLADLVGPSKWRPHARPRQVAMYLAKALTPASYATVGRRFGRHHTTVLHAEREIQRLVGVDPVIAADVAALRACLAGGFA